jgi:IS5 family transposase
LYFCVIKIQKQPSFTDNICDLRVRKVKTTFFGQINLLIDWESISKIIDKDYAIGNSATGKPSYDGLLLFKMCLLQS